MSRLNVGSPTARAAATARSTLAGSCVPAERGEHVRHHRLHADRDPVDAGADERLEHRLGDVVGVALDRHLGAGRQRDRPQHRGQPLRRHQRRRAAADEHARRRRHPGVDGPLDLGAHRRRGTRRSGAADRSTWRTRSSRSASSRTARGRTRRTGRRSPGHLPGTRPSSTPATTAAVSTRSTLGPSETCPAAAATSAGDQPPSGPMATVASSGPSGRPPGSATTAGASTSAAGTGPATLRQPHPPGLHRRLDGDPPQPGELPGRPLPVPAHDRALGRRAATIRSTPTSVHFCDQPLQPLTLRRGDGDRHRRAGPGDVLDVAVDLQRAADDAARPPAPGPVGDRDDLAVAQPQHPPRGGGPWRRRATGRGDVVDEHVGCGPAQHLVHRPRPTRTPT